MRQNLTVENEALREGAGLALLLTAIALIQWLGAAFGA